MRTEHASECLRTFANYCEFVLMRELAGGCSQAFVKNWLFTQTQHLSEPLLIIANVY